MEEAIDYKAAATELARHIVKNWHCCPVDESLPVANCGYWGEEDCVDCILQNYEHLKN